MAFWCTTTLRERVDREKIIVPYRPGHVKHSAYELSVGREAEKPAVSTKETAPASATTQPPAAAAKKEEPKPKVETKTERNRRKAEK